MSHQHAWQRVGTTQDSDGIVGAAFVCLVPECECVFVAAEDSYRAAVGIKAERGDAGPWPPLVAAPGRDPLPAAWPPPVPHDPEPA